MESRAIHWAVKMPWTPNCDQQEKIGFELTALREQATQELEAFSTPKRKRRTKAEIAAQE